MIDEKKICFFLNWAREIDKYENIFKELPKKDVFFVINDLNKNFSNHIKEREKIISIIKKREFNFSLLSSVLGKKKYSIVISTGDLAISIRSFKGIIKFLYARSFGALIEMLNLKILIKKKFKKDITAGGKISSIYTEKFVEKEISKKAIKFPNGLERNLKYFPNDKWLNIFDVYFTSSTIESNLIETKFKNKKIFFISYFRFEDDQKNNLDNLRESFFISPQKKTIICCPTSYLMSRQKKRNIISYLDYLNTLNENFNVIIRPHPKLEITKKEFYDLIINSGLKIDLEADRKIKDLLLISDLVIADFGNIILESIYLEKKVMIYKWQEEEDFKILFEKYNGLDNQVRDNLKFKISEEKYQKEDESEFITKIINDEKYQNKINKIKGQLFNPSTPINDPVKILKELYENH